MHDLAQLARATVTCARCGYLAVAPAGTMNFCPKCGAGLREPPARPPESERASTSTSSWVGKLIADRYRLLSLLGEGGMGAVFKAEHSRMGKALAVKVLRGAFARDPAAVARFRAEAQIVSRLSHPHTIAVFDFGEIEGEGFYLAMEYVPGKDLATLLRERQRLPEARAIGIADQVLGSLAEAHEAGVVHRDVKPANIMVMETREGDFAKVLDFGIAKLRDAGAGETAQGAIIGTPSYLAPEQARALDVDERADLYAVGAVLYELVSGRPPFVAASPMAVLAAHLRDAPRPLAEVAPVSPGFAAVVHRALAKRPEHRFESARAMREALLALGARRPRAAVPPPPQIALASRADFARLERELRALRRGRAVAPLGVAAVLLLAAGVASRWSDVYPFLARRAPGPMAALPGSLRPADLYDGEEHEPNDTPADANRLPLPPGADGRRASGVAAMRGTVGAKLDAGTGDVDVYRIDVPATGRRVALVADLTAAAAPRDGIRGLDVVLTLNRDDGGEGVRRAAALVTQVDRGGPGKPERLVALVQPGTYYLAVRERHEPGAAPVERPGDPYLLQVWLEEPRPGEELEPNDEPAAGSALRYPQWKALAERNPLGEGGRISGETSLDDPDTFAVGPRAQGERPELVLLVPEPRVALSTQLWVPDAEDLARGGPERVRFAEAGEGEPGEVLVLKLPAAPAEGAPALVRLRAAAQVSGEGRYEILALGGGAASGPALLARLDALAKAGRAAQALEAAAAFAQALPDAAARDDVLAAAGTIARELAATLPPDAAFEHERAARRLGRALFDVVDGRVRYGGAFETLVTGAGPLAEDARLRAVREALPCTAGEVAARARAFLARFPGSRHAPEARLALARAEEDAFFQTGDRAALRRSVEAYRAVAAARGGAAAEAADRAAALSRGRPEQPAVPRTRCE